MRVFHSRFGPAVSKKGIGRFGYAFQKAKEVCLLKTAPDRRKGRGLLPIGCSFQKTKEKPPFRTTFGTIILASKTMSVADTLEQTACHRQRWRNLFKTSAHLQPGCSHSAVHPARFSAMRVTLSKRMTVELNTSFFISDSL